ncbi:MAG: type III ribulose-bisphosphate carboxylase [Candidatus Woesearchaeota archaeon]
MADYNHFVKLGKRPSKHDVVASFRVKVPSWSNNKRAWGAVAAESSVGTWSAIDTTQYKYVDSVSAWVFEAKGDWIKIAYPEDHFEPGNMPQILASIAGNVFGMKAVSSLRLEDIQFTEKLIKLFPGPKFGREGIRKFMHVKERPIMLSVAKPKVGMTTQEHTNMGRMIWEGGLDLLKDDENLTNQFFNPFERRVTACLKVRDRIEKETGEKKSYLINITGPTVKEMEKRAKFIAKQGGEFAMIDIITTGWAAVNSMREICGDLGLALHAHRAMHGAITRDKYQGISMNTIAKCARLMGVDTLHIGTANVGKLVGGKEEVLHLGNQITLDKVKEDKSLHTLEQDWCEMKAQFPCSSGGLHPLLVDKVMDRMGSNIMLQIGGGIHGHPSGSYAGAKAMREAVEAYMDGIPLRQAAANSIELKQALDHWGTKGTK